MRFRCYNEWCQYLSVYLSIYLLTLIKFLIKAIYVLCIGRAKKDRRNNVAKIKEIKGDKENKKSYLKT